MGGRGEGEGASMQKRVVDAVAFQNATAIGNRIVKFGDGRENDEFGTMVGGTNDVLDVYVVEFGVQTVRLAPQTKRTNHIRLIETANKMTLERYKSHSIVVEGFKIVCIC